MYVVRLTPGAQRTLRKHLSPAAAAAVIELLDGSLKEAPYRIGHPLDDPFQGEYASRRGVYRVMYRIDDGAKLVTVTRIAHRRDAYRS